MAVVGGDNGDGVYRSSDLGRHMDQSRWHQAATGDRLGHIQGGLRMWGWASGPNGNVAPTFQSAMQPATTGWKVIATPIAMTQGPNSVAVTKNGSQTIFLGCMWKAGLWRYIEP